MYRSGQVIIITAMIMAILILSIAAMIYSSLTFYKSMERSYVEGIISNVNTEFSKVLSMILSNATQMYNQTGDIDYARNLAHIKFSYWEKAMIHQLIELGMNVSFSFPAFLLQYNKTFYNQTIGSRYVYDLIKMYWYSPVSISAIAATININSPDIGFYGWNRSMLILLNASVDPTSINDMHINSKWLTSVNLYVNREYNIPVEDLDNSSFIVKYYDYNSGCWVHANISYVYNNGGGNYTLLLSTNYGDPLPDESKNSLIIWIMDKRGIVVELYTYDHIDYVIRETAISPFYNDMITKSKQKYSFEVIQNGEFIWLNKKLPHTGIQLPPIPSVPVKQIRIYTTLNGPDDPNMVEVPFQVEVWADNFTKPVAVVSTPSSWRNRFLTNYKLVFTIPFTNSSEQKVKIKWIHDVDARPPNWTGIQILSTYPHIVIDNDLYTIHLNNNPNDIVNWSIRAYYNGYKMDYIIYGFDSIEVEGEQGRNENEYFFFPVHLPGGNWSIIYGPVRAVAYRESTIVYDLLNNVVVNPPPLTHKEILIIPYNVSYFLFFGNFTWLENHRFEEESGILTLFGEFSGDVKYGSLQLSNIDQFIVGKYDLTNNYVIHRARMINNGWDFGYWASQFDNTYGFVLFTNEPTYDLLTSDYGSYSELLAMSGYRSAFRLLCYNLFYYGEIENRKPKGHHNNLEILAGTSMDIFFAGFIYEGASASVAYSDPTNWYGEYLYRNVYDNALYSYFTPQVYYRMFLNQYIPVIEYVEN